jgi:hypothetical protein
VLPLAVFFGRLVDHEAVCLVGMLAVIRCMGRMYDQPPGRRVDPAAAICLLLAVLIWIDWAGLLFAIVFLVYAAHAAAKGRAPKAFPIVATAVVVVSTFAMTAYLVAFGLEGRWSDLFALAQGRTGTLPDSGRDLAWNHTLRAFSWPVLALCAVSLIAFVYDVAVRGASRESTPASRLDTKRKPSAMIVLHITGAIWLLAFWRQYEIHNYWVFYLGPLAAIASADAVRRLHGFLSRSSAPRSANVVCAALVVVVIACCLRRSDAYFQWSLYEEEVRAWQTLNEATAPNVRILFPRDPRDESPHGGYVFRNIIPPQMAYYLDRSWMTARTVDEIIAAADDRTLFVIEARDADAAPEAMAALGERFPLTRLGPLLVFDLRPSPVEGAAGGPTAAGEP